MEGKQGLVQSGAERAGAECDHLITGKIWHATYVLYEHIRDYLACGWMVAIPNAASHINAYGVTMEWRCSCKIVRPNQ